VDILPAAAYPHVMPATAYPENLKEQVRFYQSQAETWKGERCEEHRELEAILSLGLSLFDQIQKIDQEIANAPQARKTLPSAELVKEVSAVYEWWYRPCEPLLKAIKHFQSEGKRIENAESFIRACQKARIPAFHLQEWIGKKSA
jgi:hypothetical protein